MKGEIVKKILEVAANQVLDTALLFEAIILAGYGAPLGRIQLVQEKLRLKYLKEVEAEKERQKFYTLLSRLNKEGFIKKTNTGWLITTKGKLKLVKVLQRVVVKKYPLEQEENVKIVSFDIPERERNKRRWLRLTLHHLKFKMLQKSVWIGKVKLPEEFLHDLRRLDIFQYVHIFAILQSGTISKVH